MQFSGFYGALMAMIVAYAKLNPEKHIGLLGIQVCQTIAHVSSCKLELESTLDGSHSIINRCFGNGFNV